MEGGDVLLRELEKVRAEEKELKKKMKQEKKAKLKASKMKKTTMVDCESSSPSSSSSSESSDSDCGEVVDMNTLRGTAVAVATKPVDQLKLPDLQSPNHNAMELCSTNVFGFKNEINVVNPAAAQNRIEVCMGNKCKKSGASALMQEFEKVVGVDVSLEVLILELILIFFRYL